MTTCVLVGIPGAGKSSIGKELAKRLDVPFIDTDRIVEEQAEKSVSEIFVQDGEAVFRELEEAAVLKSLEHPSAVVSLGGGSVLSMAVRTALAGHFTIWLQTSVASALRRTNMNQNRPLLIDAPRATLIKLLEQREQFYRDVSNLIIETDHKNIKVLVDQIVDQISKVDKL